MPRNCPCRDCTERTLTCHSGCGKYKEWKAKLEDMNRRRLEEKAKRDVMSSAAKKKIMLFKRRQAKTK